jgi:hypothetical protein
LRAEAAAQGFGENVLYAAGKAEGIIAYKERVPNGRWFWMLDPSPSESERTESALPSP